METEEEVIDEVEVNEVEEVEVEPSITDVIRTTIQSMQPQQQQQQLAPLSQEEIDRRLNIYDPDEEFATRFHNAVRSDEFDAKALKGLFSELLNGVSKQHTTYADLSSQMHLSRFREEISPQLTAAQEVAIERQKDNFFKEYPSLKAFEDILPSVSAKVQARGIRFATKAEANKAVAQEAEKFIKTVQADFTLGKAQKKGQPSRVTFPGRQGGGTPSKTNGGSASIWD
jgi:hypothetical protein